MDPSTELLPKSLSKSVLEGNTIMLTMKTKPLSIIRAFFFAKGKVSRWRVCYRQGLPRLVLDIVLQEIHQFNPIVADPLNVF